MIREPRRQRDKDSHHPCLSEGHSASCTDYLCNLSIFVCEGVGLTALSMYASLSACSLFWDQIEILFKEISLQKRCSSGQ